MSTRINRRAHVPRTIAAILIVVMVGTGPVAAQTGQAHAATANVIVDSQPREIALLVGRSTIVDVGTPIARVSLTSSDIADALVTSGSQLLLNGKAPGTISMFVWERSGDIRRYEVAVHRDLATLDQQLAQLFPGEAIQAHSNGRQIVLSGMVSNKENVDKAVNVAAGFVESKADVVTLLQVQEGPRSNQVLLRVRFAEVSRSALTELGVGFFTGPTGIKNTLGSLSTQQFPSAGFDDLSWSKDSSDFGAPVTGASGSLTFSDFLNLFVLSERYDLGMLLKALQSRGLFQSLAEPNLVAESGKEASFLAGGEFPIPIAQGSGANIGVSVQFKEFGVRLSFTPTVNGNRVHLKVRPEVSMLDFSSAVIMGGFRIPGLTTRRTDTEVELLDGQTFAIAGLMNNTMNSTLQKIPGIGDIPILGNLFKSKAARKDRTELVVFITPQILPTNSPGVTQQLPAFQEQFLPPLRDRETTPPPPPAFLEPAPGAMNTPPAAPLTAAERKALEQAAKEIRAAEARAAREARAQAEAERRASAAAATTLAKQAEEDRRRAKAEAEREARLAKEQAKRDAEAAKRDAEAAKRGGGDAAKRGGGDAARLAELKRQREDELAEAEARLEAARYAYEAELESGGSR